MRLKEHQTEADKDRDEICTRSTRIQSVREVMKSAIVDQVRPCNNVLDWEGAKVKEGDKYKRWIREVI